MSTDLNMEYQEVKFGDICREVKLTTKDPIADGYDKYIGLEHLDSGSLKIKRWGLIAEDNPTFTRVFKKGHILIGKRRPYLKKAAIAEFDGICSGDIIVVEPAKNNEFLGKFLPFIIQSEKFWDHAIQTSSGSLSPRTKFKDLSDLKLLVSTNEETLKLKFKNLHQLLDVITKTEKALSAANRLNESYFENIKNIETLFEYKLNECMNGDPEYGAAERAIPFSDSKYRYIRVTDITEEGKLSSDDIKGVANTVSEKFILNNDDFLFARSGNTVGKTLLYKEEFGQAVFAGYLIRVRLNPQILLPRYFNLYTRSKEYTSWVSATARGGAQPNINAHQIANMSIKIPCVAKQKIIADEMSKIWLIKETLSKKIEFLKQKFILFNNW